MQANQSNRSGRAKQVKPTQDAIRGYWQVLKAKADAGDVQAIAVILNQTGRQS
ncbi:hypothetical protein [Cobetia sp. QF-1]|uniref:hypothetical protein n=1 Tax=Cobetia sp. QF-1 TaxID=1969833 RepID=UPI00159517C5|nr:hypothetical protein [Cobetia sp. QF-1]